MAHWWSEIDDQVLAVLEQEGPIAPLDLARRLGVSEGEATAFLCMLAREGKVRIRLAEIARPAVLLEPAAA